jgi:uncharacterized metal-binding protein
MFGMDVLDFSSDREIRLLAAQLRRNGSELYLEEALRAAYAAGQKSAGELGKRAVATLIAIDGCENGCITSLCKSHSGDHDSILASNKRANAPTMPPSAGIMR